MKPRGRRATAGLLILLAGLAVALPLGLVACWNDLPATQAGGPVIVAGTVLEAATGEPLTGVVIRGPRRTRTVSDDRGRFRLTGLHIGESGELTADRHDGFAGVLPFSALAAGVREVAFHLRQSNPDQAPPDQGERR